MLTLGLDYSYMFPSATPGSGFKNNMPSLLPSEDEGGIVGYQKYMHVINRKAVDNSDNYEPLKPELSHFLRVSEAEFA